MAAAPTCGGITDKMKRASECCLMTGKLKNVRNYYARRRPLMLQSSCRTLVSPERLSSQSSSSSKVHFHSDVLIHEIPSRKEYSNEDKRAIWMPRQELKQLILKNHQELAYEGRDWRNAPEEDEFGTDETGQVLHPMHLPEATGTTTTTTLPLWKRSAGTAHTVVPRPKKRKMANHRPLLHQLRKLPLSTKPSPVIVEEDNPSSCLEQEYKRPRLVEPSPA